MAIAISSVPVFHNVDYVGNLWRGLSRQTPQKTRLTRMDVM